MIHDIAIPAGTMTPKTCPLRLDWLRWSKAKQNDRLFMVCPSCGANGSHVGEGPKGQRRIYK